jgi:hypothetical protein
MRLRRVLGLAAQQGPHRLGGDVEDQGNEQDRDDPQRPLLAARAAGEATSITESSPKAPALSRRRCSRR